MVKAITSIRRWVAERWLAVLGSAGFAALSLWLAAPLLLEAETPTIRMSAGPSATRRHAIAEYMVEQAGRHGLSIELATCAGSEECLKRLSAGQLDAAVVSSGVKIPGDDAIRVLGAVQLEAVHVLVRSDMVDAASLCEAIRGKRVNMGERGSTEWLLSREFLEFAHLKLPTATQVGDVVPTEFTKAQLTERCQAILRAEGAERDALIAELPDCLLVVASLPSTIVQLLVEAADYRIAPLPATRAFLLDNLQESDANTTVMAREFLELATIPACSYFAERGYPTSDCKTVGVRLLVVARNNVDAAAIRPLMATVFEGEFAHRIRPKSPRELATPYEIHPAALEYLDRDKPLAIEAVLEWFSNGLSIFGAFTAGALSLYSLLRRRKARSPSEYFAELRRIDQIASGADVDATAPIAAHELVRHLDERLLQLRHELIGDICEGEIKSDQVISNILTLLRDTRANLRRLDSEAARPGERIQPAWSAAERAA